MFEIYFDLHELAELQQIDEKLDRIDEFIGQLEEAQPETVVNFEMAGISNVNVDEAIQILSTLKAETKTLLQTRDMRLQIETPTDTAEGSPQLLFDMAETLYNVIKERESRRDVLESDIDADMIAVALYSEFRRVLTLENLIKKDEENEKLKKIIEESGLTEGIESAATLLFRGTTLDELLEQYDPITQTFTMAAPYTETGKAIREGADNVTDIIKKEIGEGKILGPSFTMNVHPAGKFSRFEGRSSLITMDNPRIIVQVDKAAFDEAVPISMLKAYGRKTTVFPYLSTRVWNPDPEVRYRDTLIRGKNPNRAIGELLEMAGGLNPEHFSKGTSEYLKPIDFEGVEIDLEEIAARFFDPGKHKQDFIADMEFYMEGGRFSEDKLASVASIAVSDMGVQFHEDETMTVLPLKVRPDQMVIHVLPKDVEFQTKYPSVVDVVFEEAKERIEAVSPFFKGKVMKGLLAKQTGAAAFMQGPETFGVDISAALEEIREFQPTDEEVVEFNMEGIMRGGRSPFMMGFDVKDIQTQIANITKNVIISMGVINVKDRQKMTRFIQNVANRYIKDYILTLFEQTI